MSYAKQTDNNGYNYVNIIIIVTIITGIISGAGSIIAALGQLSIPVFYRMGVQDGVGFRYVWFFLIVCAAVGTCLLGPRYIYIYICMYI
jgi:hypothetical protein